MPCSGGWRLFWRWLLLRDRGRSDRQQKLRVQQTLKGSGLAADKAPNGFTFGLLGGKKVYLPCDGEGHIAIFGGSGQGKTSALLIPSLRVWQGPFFCIDISGDISKNVPGEKSSLRRTIQSIPSSTMSLMR